MTNLFKIASLPGSGSGCMAALPAEVGRQKVDEFDYGCLVPGKIVRWSIGGIPQGAIVVRSFKDGHLEATPHRLGSTNGPGLLDTSEGT